MSPSSEKLREVFPRVLEKQVFMFTEEMSLVDLPCGEEDWVQATMSYAGPFEGRLSLALPRETELEIAANFLGMDADDPAVAKCADDSLKEILNVICGHMLSALAGEDPVFDLSIPVVVPLTADGRGALASSPESLGFDLEGRPAVVEFTTSQAVLPNPNDD